MPFGIGLAAILMTAVACGVAHSDTVRRALQLIEQHFADSLSLQQIGDSLGRNPRYLATRFRRETGHSVHQYLTLVRLRAAVVLLREGEKVEVAAMTVGYRSRSSFTRRFSAMTGMPPTACRSPETLLRLPLLLERPWCGRS